MTHLDQEDSATFATDFGVHLAIKPFVKGFEYWVCPLMFALGFARIGARVPIWGGEDTLTEHRFNRLADHIVRRR